MRPALKGNLYHIWYKNTGLNIYTVHRNCNQTINNHIVRKYNLIREKSNEYRLQCRKLKLTFIRKVNLSHEPYLKKHISSNAQLPKVTFEKSVPLLQWCVQEVTQFSSCITRADWEKTRTDINTNRHILVLYAIFVFNYFDIGLKIAKEIVCVSNSQQKYIRSVSQIVPNAFNVF